LDGEDGDPVTDRSPASVSQGPGSAWPRHDPVTHGPRHGCSPHRARGRRPFREWATSGSGAAAGGLVR